MMGIGTARSFNTACSRGRIFAFAMWRQFHVSNQLTGRSDDLTTGTLSKVADDGCFDVDRQHVLDSLVERSGCRGDTFAKHCGLVPIQPDLRDPSLTTSASDLHLLQLMPLGIDRYLNGLILSIVPHAPVVTDMSFVAVLLLPIEIDVFEINHFQSNFPQETHNRTRTVAGFSGCVIVCC